jgi:hypothetical protein
MRISALRCSRTIQAVLLALPLAAILIGELQVLRYTRFAYLRARHGYLDTAQEIDRLIGQIEPALPPFGSVGYIDPGHSWSNPKSTYQFYLTQYAIVPRVLVYDTRPDHVIYFSHLEAPLNAAAVPEGMRVSLQIRPNLAVLTRTK